MIWHRVGQNRNANFVGSECEIVRWFGGRESIFLFSHTNEFCGTNFVALEPGLACAPLKVSRRVCEGALSAGATQVQESTNAPGQESIENSRVGKK